MKKLAFLISAALVLAFYLPSNVSANQTDDPLPGKTTYSQIKVTELPNAVSNSVTKDYPDCTIEKAYSGSNGTYKVEVKKGMENHTLIYDKDGKFVKKVEHMKSTSDNKMQ